MKRTTSKTDSLQFTSILERSDNRLWGAHFRVPGRIVKRLVEGKSRRVVCTLNGSQPHQCALLPHGGGSFVITVNKKLRDALGLAFGTEVRVRLERDKSEYGLPLPEELHELLQQDPEGKKLFLSLTPGRKRTLLYIIGSVKSQPKRVERAVVILTHLKANGGKINYKQLYALLKDPRHPSAKFG